MNKYLKYTGYFLIYALISSNTLPFFDERAMRSLSSGIPSFAALMILGFLLMVAYMTVTALYILAVSASSWSYEAKVSNVLRKGLRYLLPYSLATAFLVIAGPLIAFFSGFVQLVIILEILSLVLSFLYMIFLIPYVTLRAVPQEYGYFMPSLGRVILGGLLATGIYLVISFVINYVLVMIGGERLQYLYFLSWNPGNSSPQPFVWTWGDVLGVIGMSIIYELLTKYWVRVPARRFVRRAAHRFTE